MARLHTLARRGDYDEALTCIADGADVNAATVRSFTPLMLAAQNQHLPIVTLLLKSGADVNLVNRHGNTALHLTAGEMCRTLAARDPHLSVVTRLLEAGAQVNLANYCGDTALHLAATQGYIEVVQALIRFGADVNSVNNSGSTVMLTAARHNRRDIVDFLKEQGADPSRRSHASLTSAEMTADEWLAEGGIFGQMRKRSPDVHALACESPDQRVRKQMAEGLTPEEDAAKHGRATMVYATSLYRFEDPVVDTWAHRLAELVFTPGLMEQYEERVLQGEELEEARRMRTRRGRMAARRNKKKPSCQQPADVGIFNSEDDSLECNITV